MALTNLIDLIAEVAAKRAAREAKAKADTPDEVRSHWPLILAKTRNLHRLLVAVTVFWARLDKAAASRKTSRARLYGK